MRFFEDMTVGERTELGSHTFTAEEIKAFAHKFDPQRFHVDEEAAQASHFGRLCASGWHTAAVFMRHFVEFERARGRPGCARTARRRRATGRRPASASCAGSSRSMRATPSASRARCKELRETTRQPGWGLMVAYNTGTNQHGELVFSFIGAKFAERRKKA